MVDVRLGCFYPSIKFAIKWYPMKVKALFFATCRDIVGSREFDIEIEEGSQVGDVKRALMATYPNFPATTKGLSVAVNAEYVDDCAILCPGDEIAFIPPVSGG